MVDSLYEYYVGNCPFMRHIYRIIRYPVWTHNKKYIQNLQELRDEAGTGTGRQS
jgi:hypothetical protein